MSHSEHVLHQVEKEVPIGPTERKFTDTQVTYSNKFSFLI